MVESSVEESIASSGSPGQSDDPETQPPEQAEVEGTQAGTSEDAVAISVEEEQILLDGTALVGSPASDASSVTGHLATMQVSTSPREVMEDGDTSK